MDDPSILLRFTRAVFLHPTFQYRGLSSYYINGTIRHGLATWLTPADPQCVLHWARLLPTGTHPRPLLYGDAGPAWTEGRLLLLHRASAAGSVLHARGVLAHEPDELAPTGHRPCSGAHVRLSDPYLPGVRRRTKPSPYARVLVASYPDTTSYAARFWDRFQSPAARATGYREEHWHGGLCAS